jgi:hypothetical protein
MDAYVKSVTLSGIDGRVLEVTAVAEPGLPRFEQPGCSGAQGARGDRTAALGLRTGEMR